MPLAKPYEKRFSAGMLRAYRSDHKIRIDWSDLKNCEKLRQACKEKVEEERGQRMMDKLFARIKARDR
jgi:hypothetical protein